jgi:general secretion pathway protein G
MQRKLRRAFTLIELLVVLVILALLAGIVLPKFLTRGKDAQVAAARTQIANFKGPLSLYSLDNDGPPSTQQGLAALLTEPTSSPKPRNWKGPYLDNTNVIPLDPWGNPYEYQSPGPNGEDYYIISYGEDGKPGGDGYAADIDSTQNAGK